MLVRNSNTAKKEFKPKPVPQRSNRVQNIEQRSIAIFSDNEGAQSLPARRVNVSEFHNDTLDKIRLNKLKTGFDKQAWNERNRPGNNKNTAIVN